MRLNLTLINASLICAFLIVLTEVAAGIVCIERCPCDGPERRYPSFDPGHYLLCTPNQVHHFTCPFGLHFDAKFQICLPPSPHRLLTLCHHAPEPCTPVEGSGEGSGDFELPPDCHPGDKSQKCNPFQSIFRP